MASRMSERSVFERADVSGDSDLRDDSSMGESVQVLLAVFGSLAGAVAVVLAYSRNRNDPWTWVLVAGVIAAACFVLLIVGWVRRFSAPDFFKLAGRRPFERDGLLFIPRVVSVGAGFQLVVYYQNRFQNRCAVSVWLAPVPGSLLERDGGKPLEIRFDVDGGCFGVARQSLDLPPSCAGQVARMEVAARVRYPERRGRSCNLQVGLPVGTRLRTSAQEVRHVVLLALVGRLQGRPAQVSLPVPSVGSGPTSHQEAATAVVLWQSGQPEDRVADVVAAVRA
jgi:hypothetical protein